MQGVSIIVTSFNEIENLKESIPAFLSLNYQKNYFEIIVMDESTSADALDYLKLFKDKIRLFHFDERKGAVACKKLAVFESKFPYFALFGSDCVPEKNWLKIVMKKFNENKKYGFVSTYDTTGGACTVYLKKAVSEAGGFTDKFNEKGSGMRDDTDLAFRIWDAGYESFFGYIAKVRHEHKIEPGFNNAFKYARRRLMLQRFDPLLYREHPVRAIDFFGIKYGFWIPFSKDFKKATGQWMKSGNMKLSSPTGVVFMENKSIFHTFLIVLGGIAYAFFAKLVRLSGSIKYGKLLI
ncbi:MAG: glycosyltransferase [Candidatus Diapherotrites archaeon]|nr:glycosyltransferase [Candidatus Diapherotrites archaeon]